MDTFKHKIVKPDCLTFISSEHDNQSKNPTHEQQAILLYMSAYVLVASTKTSTLSFLGPDLHNLNYKAYSRAANYLHRLFNIEPGFDPGKHQLPLFDSVDIMYMCKHYRVLAKEVLANPAFHGMTNYASIDYKFYHSRRASYLVSRLRRKLHQYNILKSVSL